MNLFILHGSELDAKALLDRLFMPHGSLLPAGKQYDAVIAWGMPRGQLRIPAGTRLLNRPDAVARASDDRSCMTALTLHGIKTENETDRNRGSGLPAKSIGGTFSREYRVPVFQLDALAVYEKKQEGALLSGDAGPKMGRTFQEMDLTNLPFHAKRAMREAVKSVYALGLDYAIVHIGIRTGGDTVVVKVRPVFELTRRYAELFASAIERYGEMLSRELERKTPVMLGADPEFILQSPDGKVVPASRFFEREGQVGSDGVVLHSHRVVQALAELRPAPSSNPRELVRRLRQAMKQAAAMLGNEELAWLAGGMPVRGLSLGGHIHFSGLWPNIHVLRALDHYLAMPMSLVEGEGASLRRPRYGFLGDFRKKPHGGFEYRTLPSWLVSPDIAAGVLVLARLIADHYPKLTCEPLADPEVQRAYYAGDKQTILPHAQKLWKELEATPVYKAYRKELDAIKERLFACESWDEQADIRESWSIGHGAPVPVSAGGDVRNPAIPPTGTLGGARMNVWLAEH